MRRSYQWHWHYIPFSSFADLSVIKIADTAFYGSFYEEFKKRYATPDQLNEPYKLLKEESLENILQHIDVKDEKKVLSISCGNGYVEYRLLQERPNIKIYCTELSENIPSFLDKKTLNENLRIGFAPQCLNKEEKFDIIYIIEVDYALTNAQWVSLLKGIQHHMSKDGIIIIHSTYSHYSFSTAKHILQFIVNLKMLFSHFILKRNIQFWGWKRSIQEHLSLCAKANMSEVDIQTKGEALTLTYHSASHSNRNKRLQPCYLRMAEKMSGEQVWFWGAGAAYEYYKQSLTNLCPQGMILPPEFAKNIPAIDGIPVISPATAAARSKQMPIIVFTRACHQDTILKQIWAYFGSNAQIHPVILY